MRYFSRSRKYALLSMLALALVILLASVTLADLPDDGRINVVHHFGGDALYCVDRNMNPTKQYSDFGEGGFRLLNTHGQVLWFVPASVVDVAAAQ